MLLRHTLLYLPAQILGPLFQFIGALVWTFWFTPDAYGVLTFVMATQELAFLLCLAWWSQATLRYYGAERGGAAAATYRRSEAGILLATSLAQAGVALATLSIIGARPNAALIVAALGFTVSRSLLTHLAERARAAGRIFHYSVSQIAGPVLGFGIGLLAVMFLGADPSLALGGYALAQIATLIWLWRALGLGRAIAPPDRALLTRALRFGAPLLVAGAFGWVTMNGARVLVEHMRGLEAMGMFAVGWGLGHRLASFVAMLVTAAAFPLAVGHFHAGRREAALAQLARNGALLFSLLAPAIAGVTLIARPFAELMVAPAFQQVTIVILPIAALSGAVRNLRVHFADQAFLLFEDTRRLLLINAIEAVCAIAGCAVGLALGGLPGACAGCLFGNLVGFVHCFAEARLRYLMPLPFREGALILCATAVMSATLLYVPWRGLGPTPGLAAAIGLGAIVYGAALAAFAPHHAMALWRRLRPARPATGAAAPF